MKNLKILNLNTSSINQYKNCFDSNGSPKKLENIEWQFFKNTEKKGFVDIAFDESKQKTAAIYAVSCVKFKIDNELHVGTQSLDTITDIDYRGKGLFIKLAENVYNNAINENVALVYGFPNGNSIYGFEKKLQWKALDPLPFLIKPLRTKYFTDKIKFLKFMPNITLSFLSYKKSKSLTIKAKNNFPEEVNDIWKIFSKDIAVAVIRNKEYLDWRYIAKPHESYEIAHCYDNANNYKGFIVYVVKEKHNGKIGYIMEMIYDINDKEVGKQLLSYAVNSIKKQKADCILNWCFDHSPNFTLYKSYFFINMPEKLRPIELHFGVRSFNKKYDDLIYTRDNWYISYSDSDTV
ncbi:GNAT family N-acetyltransferase [Flavobacterium gelidilacus]|uniref:GNAT family N-acetyltransferase n=1 Tax=Flavobacterium gelidilacus TaxID=206041 RepID=UPI0004079A3A|nr:GNAT family N-acetyltransferase [Flavobacterium gelidilacus]